MLILYIYNRSLDYLLFTVLQCVHRKSLQKLIQIGFFLKAVRSGFKLVEECCFYFDAPLLKSQMNLMSVWVWRWSDPVIISPALDLNSFSPFTRTVCIHVTLSQTATIQNRIPHISPLKETHPPASRDRPPPSVKNLGSVFPPDQG